MSGDERTEIEGVNSYGPLQDTLMIEESPLIFWGWGVGMERTLTCNLTQLKKKYIEKMVL